MQSETVAAAVSEAIVLWTGHRSHTHPDRDGGDQRVVERFGSDDAAALLIAVRAAEEEFYASDARQTAGDLVIMGNLASAEFRERRPELSSDAVAALAWCYTFDFR